MHGPALVARLGERAMEIECASSENVQEGFWNVVARVTKMEARSEVTGT